MAIIRTQSGAGGAWGRARVGATLCACHNNDTYLVFYGSDLEHLSTAAAAVCCMPRLVTLNIIATTYLCMGYVTALTLAAVIGHHTPHARWLGTGRYSVLESRKRSPTRNGLTVG